MSERIFPVFLEIRNEFRLSRIELTQMRQTVFETPINELPDTKIPSKRIPLFVSAQGESTSFQATDIEQP